MLRVSAVKELPALSRPALSRMGDAGASDREGSTDDRRVGDGPEAGCSSVAVGVRRVVIAGTQFSQSKVPVAAWAEASCSWSRGVCVNGGSGPRPADYYSLFSLADERRRDDSAVL